jgi:predicted DNA-binding antitoxin AbrB/MazE fold protein
MSQIHAIYTDGIFRPLQPVNLPDSCEVEFEPHMVKTSEADAGLEEIYTILSERYDSGETDVAARHNEHQP